MKIMILKKQKCMDFVPIMLFTQQVFHLQSLFSFSLEIVFILDQISVLLIKVLLIKEAYSIVF